MNESKILTVTHLASLIKDALDGKPELAGLWVRGEISNFKKHTAGHLYFSLKDNNSSIRAVMFKSRTSTLNFLPKDGMDCLVRGYISLYPRDVMVQLYVEEIVPAGIGLHFLALEEMKKKLQSKGYFAPERKRSLPRVPRAIGVVTSPTGAAIRDIQNVVQRRYPGMPLVLFPALVQGDKAAKTVAEGIRTLGKQDGIDVIIVARGGGSVEDLAVFNAEIVADAVFSCPKPVISAVGHEIDYTITDLVADVRAATPTAAGEMAVPVKEELLKSLEKTQEKLYHFLKSRVDREQVRLGYLVSAGPMKHPERWLGQYQDRLAKLETKFQDELHNLLRKKKHDLQVVAGKLQALSPLDTLARGYSICKDQAGNILSDWRQIAINEDVDIQLRRGRLVCTVVRKEGNKDE